MNDADTIEKNALSLTLSEKAKLIDTLIESMDKQNEELVKLWAVEAEERVNAHDNGMLRSISIDEVLEKYRK